MNDIPEIHVETSPLEQANDPAEDLAYRLRQQRLTADFGYFALKTDALDELLQEATRVASLGLNSEFAKVLEHQGGGQGFVVRAGVGWRPGIVGHATVGDDLESPAGFAYHTRKPVISNHLDNEERFRTPSLLVEHGVKRAINVLIQTDSERYGVLEVDSPDEGKFDELDTAFLEGFANLLGVAIQRKQRDETLRFKEKQLEATIRHQEVLTHEISHRVKNSLTVVGSLLAMQARGSSSEEIRKALTDAQSRVQTIASVHDRLWRTDEVHTVSLDGFMIDLCRQLETMAGQHTLLCDVEPVTIQTDQAVTLGLLANELITNAFKYAYQSNAGEVVLRIFTVENGDLYFSVSDKGAGLPDNFNETKKSLGMKLISSLSQQLGGSPHWMNTSPGTRFMVQFRPIKTDQ
ncbi:sensor histidine kinase [Agrobacterium rosae]|uniref:histidine kinase n=2 Tax=Agrobacterium rosae TaxID=1972867 RepID=A0AAW9FKJ6_9HYPH|nr:histidine kinase dimerization/phosphoacceptor domain -containing protein [Agrobacterium rosae]MDX8306015.1 histidine kinase dimerization/phosphoacceptor domain -containing protein [Agrobacterium rosae]